MMVTLSHLDALQLRLSNERGYLAGAKSAGERELRTVWIAQIEREIVDEYRHLGIEPAAPCDLSDDDLMRELLS